MNDKIRLAQIFDVSGQFTPTKASVYLKRVGINDINYFSLSNIDEVGITIDATNFLTLTQNDYKYILGDTKQDFTGNGYLEISSVTSGNTYPIANYPIKGNAAGLYYIWIRGLPENSTFAINILIDGEVVSSINEVIEENIWTWFNNSFVLPDTNEHTLGIESVNSDNLIDKIHVNCRDITSTIPVGVGPNESDSPYFTVHMQIYRVDNNFNFYEVFDIYNYKNSIDEIFIDDWYNFDINVIDGNPTLININYSEKAALVLSTSGVNEKNFIVWEMVDNDEYQIMPSAICNKTSIFINGGELDLNLKDYYNIISGIDVIDSNTWYINYDKRHSFSVYSDYDRLDEDSEKIIIEPIGQENLVLDNFSEQSNLSLYRTQIIGDGFGGEDVDLKLGERVITILMDQSGSMTWNDNNGIRYDITEKMMTDLDDKYPGTIKYNIIKYCGEPVDILFYGVAVNDETEVPIVNSLNSSFFGNEVSGYIGTRVVRKKGSYPNSPIDGDIVLEGFITKCLDTDLDEGTEYFYSIFTYNEDYVFSPGINISATPRDQIIPRGITLNGIYVLIGSGTLRDGNTVGLWHFDKGEETVVYDFSDNKLDLNFNIEPLWYEPEYVAAGTSGVRFNGIDVRAISSDSNDYLKFDNNDSITIMAWIYPYNLVQRSGIVSRYSSSDNQLNYAFFQDGTSVSFVGSSSLNVTSTLLLNESEWNHVAVTYNSLTNDLIFYVNGNSESFAFSGNLGGNILSPYFSIGYAPLDFNPSLGLRIDNYYFGRITEVSVHDTIRSSSYINEQIVIETVVDSVTEQNIEQQRGLKGDNGDRLVLIKYAISENYNFVNGNIKIIRREFKSPSWDGDSESVLILNTSVSPGYFYTTDAEDFVLDEIYYYRIYSQNTYGNFSYNSDSPILEANIPVLNSFEQIDDVLLPFFGPINFVAQAGNQKVYLTWENASEYGSAAARVKIYHSYTKDPVISEDGESDGNLIFNGFSTDINFVHRDVLNNKRSYYSIVYEDRYGRVSQTFDNVNMANASSIPTTDADETGIPLLDVENTFYEIVDSSTISLLWKNPVEFEQRYINGYLDQEVFLFAAITNGYGEFSGDDVVISMDISADIKREEQADDVFVQQNLPSNVNDKDLYEFVVSYEEEDGIIRGTLNITKNENLLRLIKEASFEVFVKCIIPHPTEDNEDIFTYKSEPILITLKNPWELEIKNRDNKKVKERCYFIKKDEQGSALAAIFSNITISPDRLVATNKYFNGMYVGAENPFVARVILNYQGENLKQDATVDVAVWDAKMDLCTDARNPDSNYKGDRIQLSSTVVPSANTFSVQNKEIEELDENGLVIGTKIISFADILLYATSSPQAVKLFVRGGYGAFSSIKDIYIVFQTTLNIDILANAPFGNGVDISEQSATAYLIDPDNPDNEDFNIIVPDDTMVKWNILERERGKERPFYSIENINLSIYSDGIYSITRNGTSRNVFFGPVSDVALPFEQYEINATVTYNEQTRTSRQFVEIDGIKPREPFLLNEKFLMEFDKSLNGNGGSKRANKLWADGIDYLKVLISRDPNSSNTRFSYCFRNCAASLRQDLLELSSEQVIKLISDNSKVEFIWGNVSEVLDPYTNEWILDLQGKLNEDYFISKGNALVTLEKETVSDSTNVFIRLPTQVPKRSKLETGLAFELREEDEYLNPCECLKIKDEFTIEEDIIIEGKTVVFANNNPLTVTGGGNEEDGIPPTIIAPYEPLSIEIIKQQVDGIDSGKFKALFGNVTVNGNSTIDITVKVSFRGKSIPSSVPIYVVIGNNDGLSKLVAERNIVFTYVDEISNESLADIKILPVRVPDQTFSETVKIICRYDELGSIEREKNVFIFVKVLSEEESVEEPYIDFEEPEDEPDPDSVFSGTMERYNIETNEWTSVDTIMAEERGSICLEFANEKLYAIGGINKNIISKTIEEYNLETNIWTKKTDMPTSRYASMSVSVGNNIYIIGGIKKDVQTLNQVVSRDVEVYNIVEDTWSLLEEMPVITINGFLEENYGICFGAAKYFNINGRNLIYVISGAREINDEQKVTKYNDRILYYDIDNNQWNTSDLLTGLELEYYERMSFNYFTEENKITVTNGIVQRNDGTYRFVQDSFSYDVVTGDIQTSDGDFTKFPVLRGFSSSVTDDLDPSNVINHYFLGGSDNDSNTLKTVEKINSGTLPFGYEKIKDMLIAKTEIGCVVGTVWTEDPYIDGYKYLGIPHIFVVCGYSSGRDDGFLNIDLDFDL